MFLLLLKCSACRRKLWKYYKIGQGEVLRCHKERIRKIFVYNEDENKIKCVCGNVLGIDKGSFIKMIAKSFTYRGGKENC